jgi:hypothetical protein
MSREPFTSIQIDPEDESQVLYWADQIKVAPAELKAAIRLVGRRVYNLRCYFRKSAGIVSLQERRDYKTAFNPWTAFPPVA